MREEEEYNLLPRKEIEKIVNNLDWDKLFKNLINYHIDDYGNTYAILDLETGEVNYKRLSTNSSLSGNYIYLTEIPQNTIGNWNWNWCDGILDENECSEANKMIEESEIDDYEEYLEVKGIDFFERYDDFLLYVLEDGLDLEDIDRQLDEKYQTV